MKLKEYGIKITLFDPDDPETKISITLDRVPRMKVMFEEVPCEWLYGCLKRG